jgi:hypothetical protein
MNRRAIRPPDLVYFCDDAKSLKMTRALLTERGVEILAPTNSYEVIRFRAKAGVGVVYKNLRGRLSANDQAMETFRALASGEGGTLAPVRVTKNRVKGERRAGELAAIIERDGDRCFFCGEALPESGWAPTPELSTTIEHLVARAHGGPEHISNKFAAHEICNLRAGHLSAPEKIAMREQMRAAAAKAVAA